MQSCLKSQACSRLEHNRSAALADNAAHPASAVSYGFVPRIKRTAKSLAAVAALVAAFSTVSLAAVPASAVFQPIDTTTQGAWPNVYGRDGYVIANGVSNPAAYAAVNFSGASTWTWLSSTSDPRALYTAPSGSADSRIASTYYSQTGFTIDLTLTGGAHQVALYLLDLDTTQRAETISILDPGNGNAVLDTRSFSNFHNGEYAIWTLQGHVVIQVTNTGGLNAVVSGLFFGLPPTPPPTAAITAPTASATVTGSVTVTANAAATAPATVASIQFQLDNANLGAPVTSSPYTTSWDSATVKNGSHTLTAIVTDSLGQHATSAPVTVTSSNAGVAPPIVTISTPIGGATVSATVTLTATVSSSAPPISVQFQLDNTNLSAPLTASPYSISWATISTFNGQHTLTAIATDNLGQSTTSAPVVVTVFNPGPPAPAATFVTKDTTTAGNWVGVYGQNGALIADDSSVAPPAYATVTTAASPYAWAMPSTDTRALYSSSSANVRIASTYYSSSTFTFDINLTDFNTHQVALYALDLENFGRAETVTILNANTNATLDTRSISGFGGGVYLVWNLTGHVVISVTNTGSPNAVVSGLFFGFPPTPAPTAAITAPAASATVTGNAVTVTATASATSPASVSSVQFQLDNVNLGNPVSSSPYTISWDSTTVRNGPHTLTALVTDSLGQHGTSASVTVTTSNAGPPAPIVSIVAPVGGATVSNAVSVSATVSSSAPPVSVQFQLDNVNLGAPTTVSPYTTSWDSTTATNGSHTLTAIATDNFGQSTTSAPVSVTVSNTAPTGGPFITAYTSANPRSDFSGFVGTSFIVGAKNLSVQSLGRVCLSGNSATHVVKLVNTSGSDVPGASASVSMAGCTPGKFVYVSLSSAVTLAGGSSYYLATQEAVGGDTWFDVGAVTSSTDASIRGGVYSYNGSWIPDGSGSLSYGPPNFLYAVSGGTSGGLPTVTMTSPANTATVSGSATLVSATASAAAPATVSSVQFQLDGSNLGAAVTASPYSVNWDTTTAGNGTHILSAIVKDSLGQTANSGSVSVTVSNSGSGGGAGPGTALVTGYSTTSGNARTDFGGFLGMSFTVNQPNPMLVSALGRLCLAGNSGTHTVKLVDAVTFKDVSAASVNVSMAGCTAGQFVYTNLPNNIQLTPGSVYYLVSQEVSGGDAWYDAAGVTVTGVSVNGSIYLYNGSWVLNNDGVKSYVPPNLKFAVAGATGAPPTVSITNPAAGVTTAGSFVVTAAVAASAPATASSVTFYLDGVSLGTSNASPFSVNWDTTQTTDGAHTLTAIAADSAGLTTISAPVSVTVSNNSGGTGGGTPFVTTFGFFNPHFRNDFDGFAGMQLTNTSSTPITVTYVGRACAQSNSGLHTVKFVAESNGLDIPGASAVVNMSGCTLGQFSWAALPAPISLAPNVTYYLVSEEFIGGDLFYEKGPITTQSFASVISAVYLQNNGVWHRIAPPNYSYVPPNFK